MRTGVDATKHYFTRFPIIDIKFGLINKMVKIIYVWST